MNITHTHERKHLLHTVTRTRRTTHREGESSAVKSTKIRLRWDRIAGAIAVSVVLIALFAWAWALVPELEVNEHGSAPRCTDAIADAGGVCWGEPLPPCPTEDSTGCYWDAALAGNGRGESFIAE